MVIKEAGLKDIQALMDLYSELSMVYTDRPDIIISAISDPNTKLFVLEDGEKIVGAACLSFRIVPSFGKVGYVDDVIVNSTFRKKGFGELLTIHCIDEAKKNGCARIELTSHPIRIAANKLYRKLGFKKTGTNCYQLKF